MNMTTAEVGVFVELDGSYYTLNFEPEVLAGSDAVSELKSQLADLTGVADSVMRLVNTSAGGVIIDGSISGAEQGLEDGVHLTLHVHSSAAAKYRRRRASFVSLSVSAVQPQLEPSDGGIAHSRTAEAACASSDGATVPDSSVPVLIKVHEGQDAHKLAQAVVKSHSLDPALQNALVREIRSDPLPSAEQRHEQFIQQNDEHIVERSADVGGGALLMRSERCAAGESRPLIEGLLRCAVPSQSAAAEQGVAVVPTGSDTLAGTLGAAPAAVTVPFLYELRRLTTDEVTRLEVLEDGGVEAVVHVMRAHRSHLGAQLGALAVLANVCHIVDPHDAFCDHLARAQLAVGRAGGVAAAFAAMRTHSSCVELLTLALKALCNACHLHRENQLEALAEDLAMIPRIISTHCDCAQLVAEGLRAMYALCVGSAKARAVLQRANALSTIVLALDAYGEKHHAAESLLVSGMAALFELMVTESGRRDAEDSGALRCIMSVMIAHIEDTDVSLHTLRALALFCHGHEDRKTAAMHLGATNAILNVMEHKAHNSAARLHVAALDALYNLCNLDEANQAAFAVSGGAKAVVGAMRRHPGRGEPGPAAQVQEAGLRLLFVLSCNVGLHPMLQQSGVADIVSEVSRNFPHDFDESFGPAVLQNLNDVAKGRTRW